MFTFGYSFITASKHVDDWHKYSGYGVFLLCMWSWRKAHTTSPGYITAQNLVRFDNYPYDDLLFMDKTCPTVGIRKLARSKFDRFSNRHVARFDHYCGWIHNTVGEENYRFFLLFLLVHIGMCVYGTVVTWTLFVGEVQDKDLLNAIFYNGKTGQEVKADFWVVMHYMIMKHFELSAVLVLMGAMSIVLVLFFGFHMYMMANGMTTNEFYKWRQVRKWHKVEKSRYERALKEGKIQLHSSSAKGAMKELSDVDVGCVGPVNNPATGTVETETETETSEESDNKDRVSPSIIDPGPPPVNIYNRGIFENIKEVVFPRSLRRDALVRLAEARRKGQVPMAETNADVGKTKST